MLRQNPNSEGDHDFHLQKRRGWNAKQKQKQNSNLVNENGQEADRQKNPQSQKTVVFNEKWSIQRKRNKAERKIGTDNEIGDFEPSKQVNQNKKIWLFLSKVKNTVTEEIVAKHIIKKTSARKEEVEVKLCKAKFENKQQNQQLCFMVGVNMDLKDMVYGENFWPLGVGFQRFDFSLGKIFLYRQQQG